MPVLRTSASDFTAWSRANAILPANGKAAKSTDTTVDRKAAAVVAIGSQSAIGATPSSAIAKRWRIVPAVPAVKTTQLTKLGVSDSFIAKYNSAGTVQWSAQQGGDGTNQAGAVTVDSSGNIIVAGLYSSYPLTIYNADGSPFATTFVNVGYDSYIAKYNSAGVVQWAAKQSGGSYDQALGVTVDSSGNIIVVGYYSSSPLTIYNANDTPFGTTLTNSGSDDSFVVKYNSAGTVQWVAKQGGTGSDNAQAVTVDSSGNIIVAGHYSSTLTIYNAGGSAFATTLGYLASTDAYIAKYDKDGAVQWVARQNGSGDDSAKAVTVDSSGNIIVVGYYSSNPFTIYSADGSPFATTFAASGYYDAYIAKYNSAGVVQWVARQSGSGTFEQALGVTVDSSGNIIVGGYFNSNPMTIYNADGSPFATTLANPGGTDSYIAKYNSAGVVQWVAKQGGEGSDRVSAITVDSSGNIIVAGHYSSTLTIYNANGTPFGTTLTNQGGYDGHIVKYDKDGTVLWAASQGGSGGADQATSVTVDSSGNIIVGGYFNSTKLTCYNSNGTDILIPEIPPSIAYYR